MADLNASQQSELEKSAIRTVFFVELHFKSTTLYFSTAIQNIDWGGFTWVGLGTIGNITAVDEAEGVDSKSITFVLNLAETTQLAVAIGNVDEYRGRDAKMYFCPLDENFLLVGTPVIAWRGIMDTIVTSVESDGGGTISLKCETSAYGLKRNEVLRVNGPTHKKKFPNETGFDYLPDLIANPHIWLSKRFRQNTS